MMDLGSRIWDRIRSGASGAVFTPRSFSDLGNRPDVNRALRRFARTGKIRRICRGVYDIPENHATLGPLSPDPDVVARAIGAEAGYSLQLTPARAANLLGLSSQVPARVVYLIAGSSRKIRLGSHVIEFKHAGPTTLLGAGTPAGVAIQAIRALGPKHLTADVIQCLRQRLPSDARSGLKELAHHAPRWMTPVISAVTA